MTTDRIWDNSTIDLFLKCRKKYEYRHVMDLEAKTVSPALEFGKAIHLGLEAYYTHQRSLDEAVRAFATCYSDREGDELRTVENGVKLLTTYAEVYKHESLEILGLEQGFAVPVPHPDKPGHSIIYGGKLDGLVKWDGAVYVLEHKTTSALNYSYFEQFRPNQQLDGYVYGARALTGLPIAGVLVNALEPWKEVKRVTDKTKRPEDHFARAPIQRSEIELEDFARDVNEIVGEILKCEQDNRYYKTRSACRDFNYNCVYKDLCLYGPDERFIKANYNVKKWEPYVVGEKKEGEV